MNKRTLVVIFISVLLLALPIFSASASKISLTGGKGIHRFEIEKGNTFTSDGNFLIHNKENKPVQISLVVRNDLLSCDMEDGKPTTDDVGNNKITFWAIPSIDWLHLEKQNFTIPASESYKVNYTVDFTKAQLPDYINTTNGLLCYVYIHTMDEGGSVSIAYAHKCFLLFEGEQSNIFLSPFLVILASFILALIIFKVKDYLKKKKPKPKGVLRT